MSCLDKTRSQVQVWAFQWAYTVLKPMKTMKIDNGAEEMRRQAAEIAARKAREEEEERKRRSKACLIF